MGLLDYTYWLKAESGDTAPVSELGGTALTGGTITLVDRGAGDYAWRFAGGPATGAGPSKVVNPSVTGNGVTIAFRMAITVYGSTDFLIHASYTPSGQTVQGASLSRPGVNEIRARYDNGGTTSVVTVGTSIRTIVYRVDMSAPGGDDLVKLWLDSVSRTGSTPDQIGAASAFSGSRTLDTISFSNTGMTVEVSDCVIWAEQLTDSQCATLADTGIRATLAAPTGPTINTQPSSQTVTEPATATFTVAATASAGSLTYQWQVNTGGGFSNVSTGTGGTTASYTTAATSVSQSGYLFRVNVTDSNGTTASSSATLTVNAATVIKGVSETFGVAGAATGVTAMWWDASPPTGNPVLTTASESWDGSGVFLWTLTGTSLAVGGTGHLMLFKAGATAPDDLAFSGRIVVKDIT